MSPDRADWDGKHNTPEKMLKRGSWLVPTASGNFTIHRLNDGEREYLRWLVGERARRAS